MKKSVLLTVLATLPFWVLSQINITGTVKDSLTGEGLPGAHIIIENTYNFAVSKQDGTFSFQKLKPGDYTLKVSFMGYREHHRRIYLNENLQINILMQPSAIMEDEVVISATRAAVKSPSTYQNISKQELKEKNLGQDIPFLLESTPSAVVTSDAGAGIGYTGIRIRGTDITRINVTINGVPLNDPESQAVFWVNMPDFASSVDNIQVQRGVGTSTNGAAAFGASINIQTQKLNAGPYAEINNAAGSFKTFKNTLRFGTGLIAGKWAVDGRLSKITSDGYIDRAFSDLKSFFVSGGYYGEKTVIKATLSSGKEITYQAWNGVPGDSLETNRTYNPSGEYFDSDGNIKYYDNQTDNYQQDHYQLHFSHALNRNFNINASLFYIYGRGYYESYKMGQRFSKYGLDDIILGGDTITSTDLIRRKHLDNNFYGFTFSANYNSFKKLQATFGGGYNYYDGEHFGNIIWAKYASNGSIDRRWYDNTGIKQQYNLYAKANYQIMEPLNVFADLQIRGTDYQISGTHDDLRDISQGHNFTFFNPKLGAMYDFDAKNQAYFSFAIANREPTRSDYRDADENHQPEAEKLFDYELGYNFKSNHFRANANFYYMNYKDQLVLTGEINNVGGPIFTNVAESFRAGIELTAGWKISKKLKWEVNGTFSKNKIRDFTEYVDNWSLPYEQIPKHLGQTDLAFSPEVIANSSLSYEPAGNLFLTLATRYVGKQYIDNTSSNSRKLDPWFTNDIRVNYSFTTNFIKEISFYLMVNNIFSEKYESNAWVYRYYYDGVESSLDGYFPQATVNFLAGVALKF
jgi:iron complex outermembrane receptor protein